MAILECANCGKNIFRTKSEIKKNKGGRFYCDLQCKGKAASLLVPPVEEKFWKHVNKVNELNCWTWKGHIDKNGYGLFSVASVGDERKKKTFRAPRFSWELHHGEIPKGMFVCHKCDNPSCVNPNHLFLGTPKDNVMDMISKQRNKGVGSERLKPLVLESNKKRRLLTPEQTAEAREKWKSGMRGAALAREYGISDTRMYEILKGRAYKD